MELRKFNFFLFMAFSIVELSVATKDAEPMCTSRFDFEEKLLSKMVRLEHAMELWQDSVSKRFTKIGKDKTKLIEDLAGFQETLRREQTTFMAQMHSAEEEQKSTVAKFIEKKESEINNKLTDLNDASVKGVKDQQAVVFYVKEGKSELVDSVPIFKTMVLNEGEAYKMDTGRFTTPLDGIYQFTITIRSTSKGSTYCHIQKHKTPQSYALSEGTNNMATTMVYLKLRYGDVVFPFCGRWSIGDPSAASFSGCLVFAT